MIKVTIYSNIGDSQQILIRRIQKLLMKLNLLFEIKIQGNMSKISRQNREFKESCMSSNEVVLWIVFLAETIKPNSEFLLTKALNRQIGNVRQFKRSKKYENLKQHEFGSMLQEYLSGRKTSTQISNPVERHLIECIINRQKYRRQPCLQELKYVLDNIKYQPNQQQEIFDQSDNSYQNIIKIPASLVKSQRNQRKSQAKVQLRHKIIHEQFTKDRSYTPRYQDKNDILKREQLTLHKISKCQYIVHQDSPKKIQKQYLHDFLNFSINICFKAYPILRKLERQHQYYNSTPRVVQIAQDISQNQHQLNDLLQKIVHIIEYNSQ